MTIFPVRLYKVLSLKISLYVPLNLECASGFWSKIQHRLLFSFLLNNSKTIIIPIKAKKYSDLHLMREFSEKECPWERHKNARMSSLLQALLCGCRVQWTLHVDVKHRTQCHSGRCVYHYPLLSIIIHDSSVFEYGK